MTAHSTEELRRQYDAAKSRKADAERAEYAARAAYRAALAHDEAARLASLGIEIGKTKVRIVTTDRRGTKKTEPLFVESVGAGTWSDCRVHFARVKKDGTMSNAPCGITLGDNDTLEIVEMTAPEHGAPSAPPRGILHPDFPAFLTAHAQERERRRRMAEAFIPEMPMQHDFPPYADLRDGGTLDRWLGGPWWRRQHRADKAVLIVAGVACAVGAVAVLAGVLP